MNHFQGQIPSEIGDRLPGLQVLFMSDNGFNGSIPFSLGNISSLQAFDLSNNSLQGQIPGWIGNMSSLEFLDLSGNNFSGHLPPRFGTSSDLRYVYLSRNKLQGPIAMAFYDFSEMFALDLSHNNLTGTIPEWIDRLSNLRFLLLSYNNLKGEIPIQLSKLDHRLREKDLLSSGCCLPSPPKRPKQKTSPSAPGLLTFLPVENIDRPPACLKKQSRLPIFPPLGQNRTAPPPNLQKEKTGEHLTILSPPFTIHHSSAAPSSSPLSADPASTVPTDQPQQRRPQIGSHRHSWLRLPTLPPPTELPSEEGRSSHQE
uniref:Uncharacterized protein n=1 Tax=Populus alba TaxID=43335 RepID=A0A4U5N746_POPAL|nr:hypothetical protein D5086_0000281880 [Populus alba]